MSSKFARRHYKVIADTIRRCQSPTDSRESADKLAELTIALAKVFSDDNPLFNAERFYAEVGIEWDKL